MKARLLSSILRLLVPERRLMEKLDQLGEVLDTEQNATVEALHTRGIVRHDKRS